MNGPVACFNLQERIYPILRAEVAQRLSEKGLRQGRIAEHLGVSQAMVSKYLRKPIRVPAGIGRAPLQELVAAAVARALEAEQQGILPAWCPLCVAPAATAEDPAALLRTTECLRSEEVARAPEADLVLANLSQAEKRLHGGALLRLAPEVRINLAMALPNARDSRGVAAFPGRLVDLRGELRSVSAPDFGASNHLADLLLRIRRSQPAVRAILCLRYGDDVRAGLRASSLRFLMLKRVGAELPISLTGREPPDAIIDPGGFGIEPITYLLGETAVTVVAKAEQLLKNVPLTATAR